MPGHWSAMLGTGACPMTNNAVSVGLPSGAAAVRLLATLSLLLAFGNASVELYLPGLPSMAAALHASPAEAQWTLSSFLVGFGIGQLFWGPVGDSFGRRIPLLVAISVYIVASLGCILSSSIHEVIAWRLLQAFGACAGPVLARAVVRDVYGHHRSADILSLLLLAASFAPLLLPLAGGGLLWFGWRAIFWGQVAFGAVAMVGMLLMDETLPQARRVSLKLSQVVLGYAQMLRTRRVLGATLVSAFFYGGIYAFAAGSPFSYVTHYGVPPSMYGFLYGLNVVGMMAMFAVNRRLVVRLGPERLLLWGTSIAAAAGVVQAVAGWTGYGGLFGLVVPNVIFFSMVGFVTGNSIAVAMSAFPHRAGSASALGGAMQFGGGASASAVLGLLADGTPWPMTLVMAVCGFGAFGAAIMLQEVPGSGVEREIFLAPFK
ncbi:MFS transporter [Achromobacter pulmonis]|uniref:Bcr/CflA family efflux transporter n=2 Tax=Alcaligenaceae TaxID=506 RepID=A0A2N8KJR4_9BURK|nr:MFS transporter [Achromobacter pulmonis]